jgi:MoxR-like ATPase
VPITSIQAAINHVSVGLVERDTEARLLLLAALAGEQILFLGPPGTAKSELARRLHSCIEGGSYFERLLTRFSVPEELFGPLSMRALERDVYLRNTRGYLPAVRFSHGFFGRHFCLC